MRCNHEAYMMLCAVLLETVAKGVHDDVEHAAAAEDQIALGVFGSAEQGMLATASQIKTALLVHRHMAHGSDPDHLVTSVPWTAGLVSAAMTSVRVYLQSQGGNPTG